MNCLHYTSAAPQPFLLLIPANLAQDGFLGWKWSLWPVLAWLAVQRITAVFFLTLYDIINNMKYFRNICITPQSCQSHFCCWLLPIWPLTGFLGWKWSLWPVLAWLVVQRMKGVFLLTLYDSINDMKLFRNVCITPQPCHSRFCYWLLPIWP